MHDYDDILLFWFGRAETNLEIMDEKSALWWKKDEALDTEIREQFEPRLIKLANGELDVWCNTPRGYLAMIILADQFSRNMYRNTPDAFGHDSQARTLAHDGIKKDIDIQLRLVERLFFYMPLMHSESLDDQDLSVSKFEDIVNSAADGEKERLAGNLRYAIAHRGIIQRFGRYPHRNAVLGRDSTAEETEFLKQKGSSF